MMRDGDIDRSLIEQYEQMKPWFAEAEVQLRRIVVSALGRVSNRLLVRGRLKEIRTKEVQSIARKAARNGWPPEHAISNATDIIGARIVCPNIDDVYRISELLKESLLFNDPPPELQDYIKAPKSSGYRALHINARLDVGHPLRPHRVGCEIQVRTMMQDVWSDLTHSDLYKEGETLPTDLRERATDLAGLLAAADQIAQRIRDRVAEERVSPEHRPDLSQPSESGIMYLFATTFGRDPADYIVRGALEASHDAGLTSLEPLAKVLQDAGIRSRLENAYHRVAGWLPSPEDVFLFLPIAATQGVKAATKAARRAARAARLEIDRIAESEMALVLPADYESFVEELRLEEIDFLQLARSFSATSHCLICSAELVQADAVDAAISEHYGVESNGEVEAIIWDSGAEVGSFDHPSLCAYHGNQVDKDE